MHTFSNVSLPTPAQIADSDDENDQCDVVPDDDEPFK